MSPTKNLVYRFRSVNNLLGEYQELTNQEIYFASPEELNDPMEGFRDVFWQGDEIIWTNFIRNYVKSVDQIFLLNLGNFNDRIINEKDIPVMNQLAGFLNEKREAVFNLIIQKLQAYDFVKKLPASLANINRPIRRDELIVYLTTLHSFVLKAVSDTYFENKLTTVSIFQKDLKDFTKLLETQGMVDVVEKMLTQYPIEKVEGMFTATGVYQNSLRLFALYENRNPGLSPNFVFIQSEFPEKFVSVLEANIFPPWYAASFLKSCNDTAVWGHYGDGHKGVCLMFKSSDEPASLNLGTEFWHSNQVIKNLRPFKFLEVQYQQKHLEIDFFRSIGRLTQHELMQIWYSDNFGNVSACAEHIKDGDSSAEWRKQYWDNMINSVTIKLEEWKYEGEQRLIVFGDLVDYSQKSSRKLIYDFNDLEGIVFGIKTPTEDKIKIIEIIKKKCEELNRAEFSFFQAFYSKEKGIIENLKINI